MEVNLLFYSEFILLLACSFGIASIPVGPEQASPKTLARIESLGLSPQTPTGSAVVSHNCRLRGCLGDRFGRFTPNL